MNTYFVKLQADQGQPYQLQAASAKKAAAQLARSASEGAIIQVWTQYNWQERREPSEFTVNSQAPDGIDS